MHASRTITGILLGLCVLGAGSTALAATYYGTSTDAITYVRNKKVMTGYANGTFGESNLVKRAEFAKVITLIYSASVPQVYTTTLSFRDTANNAWYTPYVVYVYGNGIMTGYPDNTFRPDSSVTFAEAAKVLGIIYRLNVTTTGNLWYEGPVRALANAKAIPTSITNVDQLITRGQLADMIYRLDSGDRGQSSLTFEDLLRGSNVSNGNCGNNRTLQVIIDPQNDRPSFGSSLTYRIRIRNCNYRDERVDVSADLDTGLIYDSSSDNGYLNGSRTVRWNDLDVQSGDEQVLTLHTHLQNSRAVSDDAIDLTVRAIDYDGDSASDTDTVYASASSGNVSCYYDSSNRYICDNACDSNNCHYDSSGRYVCTNRNCTNNGCYYDSYGQYNCTNNTNTCYYNASGRYICSNYGSNNNGDCYYDSYGQYICSNYGSNSGNNNCYYDRYGQYICNSGYSSSYSGNANCYYDNNGRYVCNNDGNVAVSLRSDSTSVRVGDIVHTYIEVRNNRNRDEYVNLSTTFDTNLACVSASNSPDSTNAGSVRWNRLFVRANGTTTVTLDTRVSTFARTGDQLRINVTAAGSNNTSTDVEYINVRS